MKTLLRISIVCAFLSLVTSHLEAQNWPEFRGPTADGRATSTELPVTFSESENVVWKTPIHGKGWSSPVVWGQQIWLTTATPDGTRMSVLCVDLLSGEVKHDILLFENTNPDFCHSMNSYASPTPVIEKDRVYVHFGKYGTACFDTNTGEKVWERRDFKCDHFRGPASSPILFKDKLYVAFDGFDVQYVVALDKKTGKTVWKKDRTIRYGTDNGDNKKAYGTGAVVDVDGKMILVMPSAVATQAYDVDTGEIVWTAYHGGMNASARPVLDPKGNLLITNGMGRMVSVNPKGTGDITDSNINWTASSGVPKKSSLIVHDGLVFMAADSGILSCVDPSTGKAIWQERIKGEFAASPVIANGLIYFFERSGDVYVVEAAEQFKLVNKLALGDGFMASPAVAGDKFILRSLTHLYCVAK